MNPVYKIPIPFPVRIEVGSKHAVYENIDDIAKPEKEIEMKALQQERKNVLRAYSFKPDYGTIPILISFIDSFQAIVIPIGIRKFFPEFFHELQGLRPSLMTISADHIVGEKEAIGMKCTVDLVKKKFQFHKMVETLNGQDDLILPDRFPGIDVERRKLKLSGESLLCCGAPAAIQNFRIQIQALELKVLNILLEQPLSNIDLCSGVSGPDAENSAYLFGPLKANPVDIGSKHLDGVSKSESLDDRNQMFVGPVVRYGREFVNVGSAGIIHKFGTNPILVGLRA
jgi:hypothetical protein